MTREIESRKRYGLRRLFNKILQPIAKSSLLSGYMRSRVQKLRGVNFDDVSTVFLGEDIIIDNLEQFVGKYTKQIDLRDNAKGIYFLEIKTNQGVVNKKLVLQ